MKMTDKFLDRLADAVMDRIERILEEEEKEEEEKQ